LILAWAILLLLLFPLHDSGTADPRLMYDRASQAFAHGRLEESQQLAALGARRFEGRNPQWTARFELLEAQDMEWRGMYSDALHIITAMSFPSSDVDDRISSLTVDSAVRGHLLQFPEADRTLAEAENLCAVSAAPACGGVLRARGVLDIEIGRLEEARQKFLACLEFARTHHDRQLEITALSNLAVQALQTEHYDEAVGWSSAAFSAATMLDEANQAQAALGNLGWAYFELGDSDRALDLFLDAEKRAEQLGNIREELQWLTTTGYVYASTGKWTRAAQLYTQVLSLAQQIHSQEDIINSLEDLAHLSIETGNIDQASAYLDQLAPLVRANANHLDKLDVMLAQGRIAAARGPDAIHDAQAESIFRSVEADPASQTSMRLGAEHALARLAERQGDLAGADRLYATALTTFEQARGQLKNEDSKLPFLANAAPIYDDYINLLVKQGRVEQALAVADHSRARTLAQGLGLATPVQPPPLPLGQIAQKAGATLLFYWLGPQQSYLWAITPQKTALFPLPAESEITRLATRYRNALLGPDDPIESANPDGRALYRALVAPAAGLIHPGSNVVILGDGPLTQLNFETFIVPAPHPHYWIEDANVIAAPSLYMIASAKSSPVAARNVLLLGDALSPDPDYPALPKASEEMRQIERHFAAPQETILAGPGANPDAYLASTPQQFAYIHFVAHGVASLTDPLDSAIILSPSNTAEDSFKLYARAIIQHPLHARLVTISSCYGGGTRSYAGEGLVGLSWAFLRAGAHNVIGALWEVSDDSTPALMDSLYQGLEQGLPPSIALRQAKLDLLHQHPEFRSPFFWAPFQIYTGL
jgi:CHAT domain-containing protein